MLSIKDRTVLKRHPKVLNCMYTMLGEEIPNDLRPVAEQKISEMSEHSSPDHHPESNEVPMEI